MTDRTPRDKNGNDFDDPKWRSAVTCSTKAQVLVMRETFNANVKVVNIAIRALYVERDRIKAELAERDGE